MAFNLEGIKIIQTASAAAGPMAGRLLADWGAEVICVEHTTRKAQVAQRRANPLLWGRRSIVADIDYIPQNLNRNKRGITLNLGHDCGREIIYKLLQTSDVLLANFRPRELEKFKLEYETLSQLNPRLICAHLTGFGRKGPNKDEPGFGPTAGDSRSGFLHVLQVPGAEPPQLPVAYADFITGLSLALGIMTALFIRERTGVGQEVDASLFSTGVWANSNDIAGALITKQDRQALGRKDSASPLQNTYQTRDGRWLMLMLQELYWPRLCQAIGHEELEHDYRFETLEARIENHLPLFYILDEVFLSKPLDEWKSRLTEAGLPWAPLQTLPEVTNDPQARANNLFVTLNHPSYGRMEVATGPVKLSKTPETMRMAAPETGQHTEEVLRELGYKLDDINRFRAQGVIL